MTVVVVLIGLLVAGLAAIAIWFALRAGTAQSIVEPAPAGARIPKEILRKVRRIEIRTRDLVNTVFSGEYHSVFKGLGVEFAEVREYALGDDIRAIDWNVTARMGHPYVKVFDAVRNLFSELPEAQVRGYRTGQFSFNNRKGRCEACRGLGSRCIEMHFLPDVWVTCPVCKGKRFNRETLQVRYKGKSIADVLTMDVHEALAFKEDA